MRAATTFLLFFIALVSVANFGLFVFWLNAAEVRAIMPANPTGYTVEALALNVTILQLVLGLVGFLVAVLGFFGYAGIKQAALHVAEGEARKEAKIVADKQMRLFLAEQAKKAATGQSESAGDFRPDQVELVGAEQAKNE